MAASAKNPIFLCEGKARSKVFVISCSLRSIYPDLSGRDSKDSYRVLLYHCQLSNCKLSNCQISIRFLGIWESAVLHRGNIVAHCRAYLARQFSKVAQELRFEARI